MAVDESISILRALGFTVSVGHRSKSHSPLGKSMQGMPLLILAIRAEQVVRWFCYEPENVNSFFVDHVLRIIISHL